MREGSGYLREYSAAAISLSPVPSTAFYLTDDAGTRWRVYDYVRGASPQQGARPAPPGTPDAWRRIFVREGDGWQFSSGILPEEVHDLRPATLAAQLARALTGPPDKRKGEDLHAYVHRQHAHARQYPRPRGAPRLDYPPNA
ncbi:hypothetical protein tb265_20270 [Gemmatimonadetes bacterium T265]|nr:hypothetical protein tb265_20270 [Gemmatimonadetes bacterium T265]